MHYGKRCIYSSFPTSFNLQSFFQCTYNKTTGTNESPLFDPNTEYTVYEKHKITMTCPPGSKVKDDSCSDKVSSQSIRMCLKNVNMFQEIIAKIVSSS